MFQTKQGWDLHITRPVLEGAKYSVIQWESRTTREDRKQVTWRKQRKFPSVTPGTIPKPSPPSKLDGSMVQHEYLPLQPHPLQAVLGVRCQHQPGERASSVQKSTPTEPRVGSKSPQLKRSLCKLEPASPSFSKRMKTWIFCDRQNRSSPARGWKA